MLSRKKGELAIRKIGIYNVQIVDSSLKASGGFNELADGNLSSLQVFVQELQYANWATRRLDLRPLQQTMEAASTSHWEKVPIPKRRSARIRLRRRLRGAGILSCGGAHGRTDR